MCSQLQKGVKGVVLMFLRQDLGALEALCCFRVYEETKTLEDG